ncbi:hypothetical protein DFP74_5034 [Nocardiopsis sp. Huas11]|uniref:hypothetical protein n=1 Tax=Nocardiopsis sp. Huas11 TaxID=2183912 RepID=UPI000EB20BD7|nr:hypothetical protein [Nocardiopsis sp. Huas11]RKS09299.1 hypothetical protein DFP74_5034 [Nocardiopsis sp. Huas11]
MDPAITALAATAAATLVKAMAGDLWTLTRDKMAAVLGRDDAGTVRELEAARDQVVEHRALAPIVEQEWQGRLTRYLLTHPEAVQEVRAVLDEIAPEAGRGATYGGDHIDFSRGTFHGPVTGKSVHRGPDHP